ncbi:hypothetical protein T484DRAFT_1879887 [Baffinella frigidus]|nr:hypothetical protein T484DRAFT_1879887 [Cryptophyta sp. CCMP2293]
MAIRLIAALAAPARVLNHGCAPQFQVLSNAFIGKDEVCDVKPFGGDQCIMGEPQGGVGHGAFSNPVGGPYQQRMMVYPSPGMKLGVDYGPGA